MFRLYEASYISFFTQQFFNSTDELWIMHACLHMGFFFFICLKETEMQITHDLMFLHGSFTVHHSNPGITAGKSWYSIILLY